MKIGSLVKTVLRMSRWQRIKPSEEPTAHEVGPLWADCLAQPELGGYLESWTAPGIPGLTHSFIHLLLHSLHIN